MALSPGRTVAAFLAVTSAAVMGLSVWAMAGRASDYYGASDHQLFVFREVGDRMFTFAGRPVALVDEGDGADTAVVVTYGDQVARLPATQPPRSDQIPGLARHDLWLRVLRFAQRGRQTSEELERAIDVGEVQDRLVIVTLDRRAWADGRPMGEGQARDWLFTLHELVPDGTIRTERFGFPLGRRAAEGPRTGPPPLPEDSWQYYASLWLMPRGSRPSPRFTSDAVTALGWTLPAAAFSGLVLTVSLAFACAPRRRGDAG